MVKWFKKLYASQSLPSSPVSSDADHTLPQPHTRDAIPERGVGAPREQPLFFHPIDTHVDLQRRRQASTTTTTGSMGADAEDGDEELDEEEEEDLRGPRTAPPMIVRTDPSGAVSEQEDDMLYAPSSNSTIATQHDARRRGRRSRQASSRTMHLDQVNEVGAASAMTSEGETLSRRKDGNTTVGEEEEDEDDAAYESAPAFFLPIKRYLSENEASRARQWQDKVSQRVVKSKTSGIMNTLLAGAKPLSQNTWRDSADWQGALQQSEGTSKAWKTLVRKGIPPAIRPDVWRAMLLAKQTSFVRDASSTPFTSVLMKQFGTVDAILFKYPTYGCTTSILEKNPTLQKMCFVLHTMRPDIVYAPLIPAFAALLHTMMSPDAVVDMLLLLLETQSPHSGGNALSVGLTGGAVSVGGAINRLPVSTATMTSVSASSTSATGAGSATSRVRRASAQDFLTPTNDQHTTPTFTHMPTSPLATFTFCRTLQYLVNEMFPLLSAHFRRYFEDEPAPYYLLVDGFFDTLPMEIRFRLLDAYFNEGYKILYRYVLAILQDQLKPLLAADNKLAILNLLLHPNAAALPKKAFSSVHLSRLHVQSHSRSSSPSRRSPAFGDANHHNHRRGSVSSKSSSSNHIPHHPSRSLFAQTFVHVRPRIVGESSILPGPQWATLWGLVPTSHRASHAQRLFSASEDGYRLKTLYDRVKNYQEHCILLLIQSKASEVLGAWISPALLPEMHLNRFSGDYETFLFKVRPKTQKFSWVRLKEGYQPQEDDSFFVYTGANALGVGGGGTGYGLQLDEDLNGSSAPCKTFGNAHSLVGESDHFTIFETANIELWAIHPTN